MKPFISIVVVLALVASLAASCGKPESSLAKEHVTVKVDRVIDGDTFEIHLDGKKQHVRLIGVDTPETKKPNTPVMFYGPEASEFTKKKLEKKNVDLEWDVEKTDRYGRLLAYVWIGDEMFNRTLLKEGYARMSTFPPNVKYVDLFKKDQEEARNKRKGIWQDYEKAFDKNP